MHCFVAKLGVEGIMRNFFSMNKCVLMSQLRVFVANTRFLVRLLIQMRGHKKWRVKPLFHTPTLLIHSKVAMSLCSNRNPTNCAFVQGVWTGTLWHIQDEAVEMTEVLYSTIIFLKSIEKEFPGTLLKYT